MEPENSETGIIEDIETEELHEVEPEKSHNKKEKEHWSGNSEVHNTEQREYWSDMSPEEEDLIHRLHHLLGDRWRLIAERLPKRTAEEVQQYWKVEEKRKYAENKLFRPKCVRVSPSFRFPEERKQ